MSGRIAISFIIPSYRSHPRIEKTLKSIERQSIQEETEIVVVDSYGDLKALTTSIVSVPLRLHYNADRLHPGAARNRGAQMVSGQYLAFVDADVVLAPDWSRTLQKILESNSAVQAVGAAIQNANPEFPASKIQYWIEFSAYMPHLASGHRLHLSSSNFLIRSDQFAASGGFNEALEMSEDLEFFQRLKGSLYFTNTTTIRHYHRTKWTEVRAHLYQLGYWSGVFRRTHRTPDSWVLKTGPLVWGLLPYRLLRILLRLSKADFGTGLSAIKSLRALITGLAEWTRGFRGAARTHL